MEKKEKKEGGKEKREGDEAEQTQLIILNSPIREHIPRNFNLQNLLTFS